MPTMAATTVGSARFMPLIITGARAAPRGFLLRGFSFCVGAPSMAGLRRRPVAGLFLLPVASLRLDLGLAFDCGHWLEVVFDQSCVGAPSMAGLRRRPVAGPFLRSCCEASPRFGFVTCLEDCGSVSRLDGFGWHAPSMRGCGGVLPPDHFYFPVARLR